MEAGGVDFLKRILVLRHAGHALMSAQYEAKLNKNGKVSPKLSLNDLSQEELGGYLKSLIEFNLFQEVATGYKEKG